MRATASAHLTFGLVSIPVKFYLSASAEAVHFHLISPDGNRVKQKYVDAITGDEVKTSDCRKGYEFAKGQLVVFDQDEIRALDAARNDCVEIREFVQATEIDPIRVEKAYHLGPDKGGDKGYVLLAETMRRMGTMAMATWVSRGRDHLVVIAPRDAMNGGVSTGLVLYQLYYDDEVRQFSTGIAVGAVVIHDAERQLAERLVGTLAGDGDSKKYKNGYLERARKLIDARVAGQEIPQLTRHEAPPITDLFAALKASLNEKK